MAALEPVRARMRAAAGAQAARIEDEARSEADRIRRRAARPRRSPAAQARTDGRRRAPWRRRPSSTAAGRRRRPSCSRRGEPPARTWAPGFAPACWPWRPSRATAAWPPAWRPWPAVRRAGRGPHRQPVGRLDGRGRRRLRRLLAGSPGRAGAGGDRPGSAAAVVPVSGGAGRAGSVTRVSGPLVEVTGLDGVAMSEVIELGDRGLPGEAVAIRGDVITVQAYDYTGGLAPGHPARTRGEPLSALLGPHLLGGVFDGLLRPLAGAPTWLEPGQAQGTASSRSYAFTPRRPGRPGRVRGRGPGHARRPRRHQLRGPGPARSGGAGHGAAARPARSRGTRSSPRSAARRSG